VSDLGDIDADENNMTVKAQRNSSTETRNVTEKAFGSVKWSALMEVVSRAASPIVTIVLARILTPEIFGVVSIASIAISFSQIFWDAGLGKALVQTEADHDKAANVVFWTNIILGVIVYLCLFFSAPFIADYFKCPASSPVLRVLGLQIIIGSLSSVQSALFVRDLAFRGLFWIKLLTVFIPGVFSIPMAYFGYGVWALVAGTLAGQIVNMLLLWFYSPWRPRLHYDFPLAGKILRFGYWVLAETLAGWLLVSFDGIIVGRYFGVHDMGVYRTGMTLTSVIFGLTLCPCLPILYPSFSRLQDDHSTLIRSFRKVAGVVMTLAVPMGVGLFLLGDNIATIVFGNKWAGLGFVLSILGLKEGLLWTVGINAEAYRAIGRPDIMTKFMFVQILYFLPAYFLAAQSGLTVFLYVRLALAMTAIPIQLFLCYRILGVSPYFLWENGKSAFLATTTMAVCIQFLKWSVVHLAISVPHILLLAILILAGIIVYAATLWLVDRAFVLEMLRLSRRVLAREAAPV
jgi:O-antigen/teichoic acid export membrane protein